MSHWTFIKDELVNMDQYRKILFDKEKLTICLIYNVGLDLQNSYTFETQDEFLENVKNVLNATLHTSLT